MIIKAQQKHTRQTPRKLRLVANTVKKLPVEQALRQLAIIERKATLGILKVLKQAIANGLNNHRLQLSDLILKDILVTEGPRFRRYRAASRGRAHDVKKRTSHITVTLMTKDEIAAVQPAQPVVEAKPVVAEKTTKKTKKESK